MNKTKEDNWKPTYFYIRHVTVGQLLPLIKEGLLGFFYFIITFVLIGYFIIDDWNITGQERSKQVSQYDFFGIPNIVWFLIIFALISWFLKDRERTFTISRFDKIEWLLINLGLVIFFIIFNYLPLWIGFPSFFAMLIIGRTYEDMVYLGKENYEGRNYDL